MLRVHEENCASKCSNAADDCCLIDCKYREAGVIINRVFYDHALLRLYENYLDVNGAGKYDQWMAVVEKSIKTCMDKCKKITSIYFFLIICLQKF